MGPGLGPALNGLLLGSMLSLATMTAIGIALPAIVDVNNPRTAMALMSLPAAAVILIRTGIVVKRCIYRKPEKQKLPLLAHVRSTVEESIFSTVVLAVPITFLATFGVMVAQGASEFY